MFPPAPTPKTKKRQPLAGPSRQIRGPQAEGLAGRPHHPRGIHRPEYRGVRRVGFAPPPVLPRPGGIQTDAPRPERIIDRKEVYFLSSEPPHPSFLHHSEPPHPSFFHSNEPRHLSPFSINVNCVIILLSRRHLFFIRQKPRPVYIQLYAQENKPCFRVCFSTHF